jgi:hypothetical protein
LSLRPCGAESTESRVGVFGIASPARVKASQPHHTSRGLLPSVLCRKPKRASKRPSTFAPNALANPEVTASVAPSPAHVTGLAACSVHGSGRANTATLLAHHCVGARISDPGATAPAPGLALENSSESPSHPASRPGSGSLVSPAVPTPQMRLRCWSRGCDRFSLSRIAKPAIPAARRFGNAPFRNSVTACPGPPGSSGWVTLAGRSKPSVPKYSPACRPAIAHGPVSGGFSSDHHQPRLAR